MNFFTGIAQAFAHGGSWMWLILAVQIVATAIIFERLYFLFALRKPNQRQFIQIFESLIRRGELNEALKLAESHKDRQPIAHAICSGLQAAINLGGKDEIQGKMDEILLFEGSQLEKRTAFLPMFANVGTLTGLLGTVSGMITSFSAVGGLAGAEKTTVLSSGISEAMNATAYGLIMAIPTLILYALLSNRSTVLIDDLNQAGLKVFNWLSYAYEPIDYRAYKSHSHDYSHNSNMNNSKSAGESERGLEN